MAGSAIDVAVVGAGISGLSVAFNLSRRGYDVRVLEATDHPGGVIRTRIDGGWLSEAGPNSTLESNDEIVSLIDALGIRDRVSYASDASSRRYVMRKGKLRVLPDGPGTIVSSDALSARGKMRAMREPFVPAGGFEDESVAEFVERRFGAEASEVLADAFVAGVYAGNAADVGVQAAFPSLVAFEREHGSVIRGAMAAAKERRSAGRARARMFSFDGGMEVLPGSLAGEMGSLLVPGESCAAIERSGDRWTLNTGSGSLTARVVVLAVPAGACARLVAPFDPAAADALSGIGYSPVASVFLGFRRDQIEHPLDGFGYLNPSKEKRPGLGVLFSSSIFPDRAPDDCVALTVFLGGARRPEIVQREDSFLLGEARAEINDSLGVRGEPEVIRITRWAAAIPQYVPGHHRTAGMISAIHTRAAGMFVCASHSGGVSVADRVGDAARVATAVETYLSTTS